MLQVHPKAARQRLFSPPCLKVIWAFWSFKVDISLSGFFFCHQKPHWDFGIKIDIQTIVLPRNVLELEIYH